MAEPRWLNPDEQRTWRAFLHASKRLFEQLDRELQRDAAMPHAYYEILVRLSEAPGRELRMSELATNASYSRSRLSHAVSRLEEAGWVRRKRSPGDARGTLAVMTDEGYETLVAAAPGHVESVRTHLFDQLTSVQAKQLREVSEALLRHLESLRERPDLRSPGVTNGGA